MTPKRTNPATVLAALKARLKKRAHLNLDHVHAVCRAIHDGPGARGRKDYSLATVARQLEQQQVSPNYNTLKAPGGAHFKELIRAWAQWDGGDLVKPATPSAPAGAYEQLLRQIPDPALRSEIGFRLAEGRRSRAELDSLKGRTTLTIDLRPKDDRPSARANPEFQLVKPKPDLLESEREALTHALDDKHLQRCGLTVGPDGEIALGKRIVFQVGFLSGLRKLIGAKP
jgi:hypothetical protein